MSFSSLGFRLFLLSFFSIFLALTATTLALSDRFFDYFENRVFAELGQHLEQLTTNISLNDAGLVSIAPMLDRRFEQPFSGLYWQVEEVGASAKLSRSLWGSHIDVPANPTPGTQFRSTSISPIGTQLLVVGWQLLLGEGTTARTLVLSVAIDDNEVATAAAGFRKFLISWLAIMFAGLLLAAWAQVRIGLAPLKVLRERIETIRAGSDRRLSGKYPNEVTPLVDEINGLLDLHGETLSTARARASDLAHGLKTPLTVMRSLAEDLDEKGLADEASAMEAQISSMHHFVERELVRAKSGLPVNANSPVEPVIRRMVASMKRLPRGGDLNWQVDIADGLTGPFDEHDLSELVGNLLDNARKWALGTVSISAGTDASDAGWMLIGDDGPGVPEDKLGLVLKRGEILDTGFSGTGLGLAIAADLVARTGGQFTLERSELGGLAVKITW